MSDYLKKRQAWAAGEPKPVKEKKAYVIPKVSEKKKKEMAEEKAAGSDKALDIWFEDRRKELTGKCCICGGPTCKNDEQFYRASIGHLLPKRKNMFPSIATNKHNFLEFCFWKNNCHQSFDDHIITLEDIKEQSPSLWETIVDKFLKMYPSIAIEERKNIPEILLNYLPKNSEML